MPARFLSTVVVLGFLAAPIGCGGGSRPKTIQVQGKVTLNGGEWPGSGVIAFRSLSAAEGYIQRPGHALFDRAGEFRAGTYEAGDGLVPGEYDVLILYEGVAEAADGRPSRVIEGRDRLTVPADSRGAIRYEYDVRQ